MPNGYLRLATESTPGNEDNTPTLSTKKLFVPLISYEPKQGVSPLSRDDELRNQDEPLPVIPDNFEPSYELTVRGYPDTLGFLFTQLLGTPTTTVGDGSITDPSTTPIPTGAYRHVWAAPFGPTGANPITAQHDIAYRDQGTYFKIKGAAVSELGIESPEEGGVQVQASGPGLYMARGADPSLTPAYEALSVRPFTRGGLSLPTWLSGTGAHEDFSVSFSNPVEAVRSMSIGSHWPDIMEKDNEGPITVTGSLAQRQLDPDDIDALINSTGFAALAKWESDTVIASAYTYKLFIAFSNAQYVEGDPESLGNKRRHGGSFDFKSTTPSTGSTTVTLVNATASYDKP